MEIGQGAIFNAPCKISQATRISTSSPKTSKASVYIPLCSLKVSSGILLSKFLAQCCVHGIQSHHNFLSPVALPPRLYGDGDRNNGILVVANSKRHLFFLSSKIEGIMSERFIYDSVFWFQYIYAQFEIFISKT